MNIQKAAGSIGALYAHAIAMEREAAERYREFAQSMRDHGNEAMAELFGRLASVESAHADRLERETRNVAIPIVDASEYVWIDTGPAESGARELVLRLMTPFDALRIALAAEERAQRFFAEVLDAAAAADVKSLAMEMLEDEADHIEWVKEALEHAPRPAVDWEQLFARRGVQIPPGATVEITSGESATRPYGRPSHMRHAPMTRRPAKKAAARKSALKKATTAAAGTKEKKAVRKPAPGKAAKEPATTRTGKKTAPRKRPAKKAAKKK